MLTEIYIEVLDEELADQVWKAWDAGEIDDQIAWLAWSEIADRPDNVTTITATKWRR